MRQVCVANLLVLLIACRSAGLPAPSLPASPAPETPILWLRVRPLVALAPADVFVLLRIARHADNRAFVVVMDAEDDGYRLTAESLEGIESPVLHSWFWPHMPAGTYLLRAILLGVGGVRARAQQIVSLR